MHPFPLSRRHAHAQTRLPPCTRTPSPLHAHAPAAVHNSSVVRPFRYAATLTACQLVSSWTRVLLGLAEARETAQRQLAAEERRAGAGGGDKARAS